MGASEHTNVELAREFLAMITTDGAGAVEKVLARQINSERERWETST